VTTDPRGVVGQPAIDEPEPEVQTSVYPSPQQVEMRSGTVTIPATVRQVAGADTDRSALRLLEFPPNLCLPGWWPASDRGRAVLAGAVDRAGKAACFIGQQTEHG